ncbi:MAG: hypothetical protein Q9162_003874 [Coniocarpon cinnabarinum]
MQKRTGPTEYAPPSKRQKTDTRKPTAVFKPRGGRNHTTTVAVPGSIIANAQTHELKTTLAASIARALAVFCVDEVVVFNDGTSSSHSARNGNPSTYAEADAESGYTAYSDPDHFLAHVLSYLETPPHLRRRLFPHHPNLRSAGSMPSLDMPHHLRAEEWCRWREGVVVGGQREMNGDMSGKKTKKQTKDGTQRSNVDVGLGKAVTVPDVIPENTRVTVDFGEDELDMQAPEIEAAAVHPAAPREEAGYYWGYVVRTAASLSAVLTECGFEGGYDFCIGTSERGESIQSFLEGQQHGNRSQWHHLLVIFGGVAGLEVALQNDAELNQTVNDPKELFDACINFVPHQGSRTIRTDEALWLGCMGLQPFIESDIV